MLVSSIIHEVQAFDSDISLTLIIELIFRPFCTPTPTYSNLGDANVNTCFPVVSQMPLLMAVSASAGVCTHMMPGICLTLIAHSCGTLENVNGGQLMSDTVHCHLYVTHSHPNRAIHKKKVQKDLPNGFKKVKESKE